MTQHRIAWGTVDRDLATITFALGLLVGAFFWLVQAVVFGAHFWSLPSGLVLRDFAFLWGGARLAWLGEPRAVFNPAYFNAWLAHQLAPGSLEQFATWSYPPTTLLVVLPFGLLAPPLALVFWIAATFGLLALVLGRLFRDWRTVQAVALSPAAVYCMSFGQNGALTAALLIAGLWLTDRRPVLAGICFGLLTIKPQLGIPLPFALVAGGHWRALASAALTALGMVALTVLLFGTDPWLGFLHNTAPLMSAQLLHDYGIPPQYAMPTMLVTLQGWGLRTAVASYGQGAATLFAIGAVVWAWRRADVDRDWRNALTCVAVILATPFAYVYDMVPGMLAVALIVRRGLGQSSWTERLILFAVWTWPLLSVPWAYYFRLFPIGAFAIVALTLCLIRRIADTPAMGFAAPLAAHSLV